MAGCCSNKDCLDKQNCLGNRVELVAEVSLDDDGTEVHQEERVRILGVHHKNDRRGKAAGDGNIDILLPLGPFNDLLLFWVRLGWGGWGVMGGSSPELFRAHSGNLFSKSTLTQYWKVLLENTAVPLGIPYFAPNLARTSFVEEFTKGKSEEAGNIALDSHFCF